jgi:hypothetical protein
LGHPARLCERDLPRFPSLASSGPAAIRQWLVFDPLPEAAARALFHELSLRLPVLSLRQQAALTIPEGPLQKSPPEHKGTFNGPGPALIPAEFDPRPAWAEAQMTSYMDGGNLLGSQLDTCPPVEDERIRTAIELVIASRYDSLPRSVFLSQLTAIDSLAIRSDRPAEICAWLDKKIEEARQLKDNGLITSLEQLKQGSHGAAIRNLVGRAARAIGEAGSKISSRQKLAAKLYGIRSGLSHAGGATLTGENVEQARQLARFVIDAAVQSPDILQR